MNKIGLFTIMLAAAISCAQEPAGAQGATQPTTPSTAAQQPAAPPVAATNKKDVSNSPTTSDMYCSGFILKEGLQRAGRVVAGWDSPFETHYSDRANQNIIYLDRGSFSKDQEFMVVRPQKDINSYEITPGEHKLLRQAGTFYLELGRVKVTDVQEGVGIASIEFSCDAMVPGDILVPWAERPVPEYRKRNAAWDFNSPANGKTSGTLIMGREFDGLAAQRGKAYINIGANQGLKPGDYLRVSRTYEQMAKDPADNQAIKARPIEYNNMESVKDRDLLGGALRFKKLPRRNIGEMMVLYTTPTTATVTVTRTWEHLQSGDRVEVMEDLPAEPETPVAAAMHPPTISCTASPASVHVGDTSTIRCTGASPDERELSYEFASDSGSLAPHNETAVLNTANAQPGTVTVTTTVSDDQGQKATATTQVNVEAAAAPEASSAGSFAFKPSSAYVNNQAKAMLDQIALRLQREAGSSVVVAGHVADKEAARLAIARATNAKNYLVKEKGIDASRVQVADGGPGEASVDVWFVPVGASLPQLNPQPNQ